MKDSLDQMQEYLKSFSQSLNQAPQSIVSPPSLTVSRQCGARADVILPRLVDYLETHSVSEPSRWACFDKDLVAKVLHDHQLPSYIEQYMPEDAKSPVAGAIEELLALHPSEWTLFHNTADTIRRLCRMGGVIIVGRGGNGIAADLPNTFHLRLVGSQEVRQNYLMQREGLNAALALDLLRQTDRARENYVRQHLGRSIDSFTDYHLVVNTDQLTEESAATIIASALLAWNHSREDHLMNTSK